MWVYTDHHKTVKVMARRTEEMIIMTMPTIVDSIPTVKKLSLLAVCFLCSSAITIVSGLATELEV